MVTVISASVMIYLAPILTNGQHPDYHSHQERLHEPLLQSTLVVVAHPR